MQANSWTPEMQAAVLNELGAIKQGLATRQKQSALQSVLASWADALGDLGQNGAAFAVLVGGGGSVGAGMDKIFTTGAMDYGIGVGLIIGGLAVSIRVVLLDLGLQELFSIKKDSVEDEPELTPVVVKPSREKGFRIDLPNGYIILLENVPTSIIRSMVQKTARAYYSYGGSESNFSKAQLGKPWGEHLSRVKEQLKTIEYLEDAPNSTMKFTKSGANWLLQIFQGAR